MSGTGRGKRFATEAECFNCQTSLYGDKRPGIPKSCDYLRIHPRKAGVNLRRDVECVVGVGMSRGINPFVVRSAGGSLYLVYERWAVSLLEAKQVHLYLDVAPFARPQVKRSGGDFIDNRNGETVSR